MVNKGFTLVELSIVIVIIGLIVAGVVGGQSLVNQSKIRATITEVDKFRTAINSFNLEYNQLPGDMTNATSYWGGTVVNGDGNRFISTTNIEYAESLSAFEHLAMAKLIEGSYTGTIGSGVQIGVNSPKISYSNNTSFYFYGFNLWTRYSNRNSIVLSGIGFNGWNDYKIKISDAYGIDVKTDDGKPYKGQVITYSNVDGEFVPTGQRLIAGFSLTNAVYQLTDLTDLCTMHFALEKPF
jgi:prepilin-type N-terminal cleavage/methylation domain-containing protein